MKIKIMLASLLFLALAVSPLWAQEGAHAVMEGAGAIDTGNQICPVSGDKVSPKATYVHEGKKYSFCCAGCIKKFKKDPEKYIAEMEKGGSTEVAEHDHAGHEH